MIQNTSNQNELESQSASKILLKEKDEKTIPTHIDSPSMQGNHLAERSLVKVMPPFKKARKMKNPKPDSNCTPLSSAYTARIQKQPKSLPTKKFFYSGTQTIKSPYSPLFPDFESTRKLYVSNCSQSEKLDRFVPRKNRRNGINYYLTPTTLRFTHVRSFCSKYDKPTQIKKRGSKSSQSIVHDNMVCRKYEAMLQNELFGTCSYSLPCDDDNSKNIKTVKEGGDFGKNLFDLLHPNDENNEPDPWENRVFRNPSGAIPADILLVSRHSEKNKENILRPRSGTRMPEPPIDEFEAAFEIDFDDFNSESDNNNSTRNDATNINRSINNNTSNNMSVPYRNTPRRRRDSQTEHATVEETGKSPLSSNKSSNSLNYHHELCPMFKIKGRRIAYNVIHENDTDSEEDQENTVCNCDCITSNVTTNFLKCPTRALKYKKDEEKNEPKSNAFSRTPLKISTQSLLTTDSKIRNIPSAPYRVLDAPKIGHDFYFKLVDWSPSCGTLSVGLVDNVYLWDPVTEVTQLTNLSKEFIGEKSIKFRKPVVCSVAWSKCPMDYNNFVAEKIDFRRDANKITFNPTIFNRIKQQKKVDILAVGSSTGSVLVYNVEKKKCLVRLNEHRRRVCALSWRDQNILASGSRDRSILLYDIRASKAIGTTSFSKLSYHTQEVCGLEFSFDAVHLASGGNDNNLCIWDLRKIDKKKKRMSPMCYGKHKAAVKAIAWSPHEFGLLATGGGSADRCIRFWNVSSCSGTRLTPTKMHAFQTVGADSQVCNIMWSKSRRNELVSSHGFSLNKIIVWKYPSMQKLCTLTGHKQRVLYLAGSPDGKSIVTGSGDETLRFWKIW